MLFISVILPVRNEARFIERILAQLSGQDYDPGRFEILVVDGQSTDGTPERVARFAAERENVRLLANPRRLSSAARNIGIQHARGDVVLIVDGHCELDDRRYLQRLAEAFKRSGADCIGRPQPLDVSGASRLQRAIAAARSSWLGHHADSYIYSSAEGFVPAQSVAVAYHRRLFDAIGLFDESFDACEDVELNHRIDRAGLRCYFTPEVAVRYAPRESLGGLFRQLVRYGRGRMRLLRKHPETLSLGALIPALFLAGVFLGLAPALCFRWCAAAYLAVLSVYTILVLGGSVIGTLKRRNLGLLPWLPLVYVTIHVAAGTGTLWELLQPSGLRRG
ncbi:MAG: glycosyltransferase family 2 protein [Pirellulales bacterium]|nr:glycosyltransferase family 2 protein [Pirellulales bacterium]